VPVSVFLCEGEDRSPDVRLLRAVLRTLRLEVRPSGGKGGLAALVRSLRRDGGKVCGIIDGDFPRRPTEWRARAEACAWQVKHQETEVMCGWVWCRKEIENYLIDLVVLGRALRWTDTELQSYRERLLAIHESLGFVTAARMALTAVVPKTRSLSTAMPLHDDEAKIRDTLEELAEERNTAAAIDVANLLDQFGRLVPECQAGGRFFADALTLFAGKDVHARMQQTRGIPSQLKDKDTLVERVVHALERDAEPHRWLPEWEALHAAIRDWSPSAVSAA